MLQELARSQADFLKAAGRSLMPWIEAGFANPLLWPTGVVVVEVTDKDSARAYKLPLTATRIGNLLVLTSLRQDAGWLQNLIAKPDVRYWFAGRPQLAKAFVLSHDDESSADLPTSVSCLAHLLQQQSRLTRWSFAILAPRD